MTDYSGTRCICCGDRTHAGSCTPIQDRITKNERIVGPTGEAGRIEGVGEMSEDNYKPPDGIDYKATMDAIREYAEQDCPTCKEILDSEKFPRRVVLGEGWAFVFSAGIGVGIYDESPRRNAPRTLIPVTIQEFLNDPSCPRYRLVLERISPTPETITPELIEATIQRHREELESLGVKMAQALDGSRWKWTVTPVNGDTSVVTVPLDGTEPAGGVCGRPPEAEP